MDRSGSLNLRTSALAVLSAQEVLLHIVSGLIPRHLGLSANGTLSEWPFLTTQVCYHITLFIFFVAFITILHSYYSFDSLYWFVFFVKLVSSFYGMDLVCLTHCSPTAPSTMFGFPLCPVLCSRVSRSMFDHQK